MTKGPNLVLAVQGVAAVMLMRPGECMCWLDGVQHAQNLDALGKYAFQGSQFEVEKATRRHIPGKRQAHLPGHCVVCITSHEGVPLLDACRA